MLTRVSVPWPFLFKKLHITSSGLFRLQPKQIDKRTYVLYNNRIATLGVSYGTVQRNDCCILSTVSLTIPFDWPLIGGEK